MAKAQDPRWLKRARTYLGQREIAGRKHNPTITGFWKDIKAPFSDDETPWCAGFVGSMLENTGIKSSRSAAARSYEKWGVKLAAPALGAIVVFARKGGGHVGFVTGWDDNYLKVLGGNQSDAVTEARFARKGSTLRVLGYRWPAGEPLPEAQDAHGSTRAANGGRVTFMDDEAAGRMGELKPASKDPGVVAGAGAAGGGATLSLSDVSDAADKAVEVKGHVDQLGITDVLAQLTGYFTFWLGVTVLAIGLGILGYRFYRRRQKAKALEDNPDVE